MLFKSSQQDVRTIVSDEVQDLQFTGKNIFTPEEVQEILEKVEVQLKQIFSEQSEKVSKLVGSLCVQLMAQAQTSGVKIEPKPDELEDEKVIRLF